MLVLAAMLLPHAMLPLMTPRAAVLSMSADPNNLALQRDRGRGAYHLSAELSENDVVAFQTGTWLVDNVAVGDGSPPCMQLARVDVLQINWTTNGEHGWLRCTAMETSGDGESLKLREDEDIEVGPEQLLASIPVSWDEDGLNARMLCELPPADELLMRTEE